MVHDKKVDPAALSGVASVLMSEANVEKLKFSVTATLASRAHLLPRYARKEISLFESPTLWASSKIRLDQARLQLKLQRTATQHPIRDQWRR